MRYCWHKGSKTMHIQSFNRMGQGQNKSLCDRREFNRNINAPWSLGKKVCGSCQRVHDRIIERDRA